MAADAAGDRAVLKAVKAAANPSPNSPRASPTTCSSAGLDESISTDPKLIKGCFLNFFDDEQKERTEITIRPGGRYLLKDMNWEAF